MAKKPTRASGYRAKDSEHVWATCLYVATKLGDLVDDIVIVGGLVPSLLIDQRAVGSADERHAGTMDLDLGLATAILVGQRYQTLSQRLRQAGFIEDRNAGGNATRQRWRLEGPTPVTVDFLIAPSSPDDSSSRILHIEQDFAAIMTPGLHLAFEDRVRVRLEGRTIFGEVAARDVWVAGPAAFVVLKALAFRNRGENKDAYDLFYVLRYLPAGLPGVARRLRPVAGDPLTREALEILEQDFAEIDGVGPRRVADFLGGPDDALQADVRALVLDLLALCSERE